ncbi:FAD-binding protein [Shewanella sp. SG44-6]|uniref:FAD-binding oxidoreductase n=1 Tax=Shewanella sp. SG44-6 TaxID=2760959 RepID=UPI001602E7E2|nr:FAD-dependent oxidoreductase [Shewanella sp. SG44-6]MBB1390231.1 FAD-binding protein [Shewanella sp. SG44-6]|tara:strand:- start:660 stop:2006 length:1347 start_codon:yes stop_codon:yes gene_type:complete
MTESKLISDLETLKKTISGDLLLSSDHGYQASCYLFNRAIHKMPLMIVVILDVTDIIKTIEFATKHHLPISLRGGGHSICGSCLIDGGVAIDMRALKTINIDHDLKIVSVDAGVLNQELDHATQEHKLALPLGTCSSVGVVGATLGGGIGFLSRKYGLTCDNAVQFTMLTAAGNLIKVNEHSYKDLFWALRGAGSNQFGVITQIDYQLHPMPELVYGGTISWSINLANLIFKNYQKLMSDAPDDLFLYIFTSSDQTSNPIISVFGFYFGNRLKSEQLFSKLLNWAKPLTSDLKTRPYLELQSAHYQEGLAIYWKHGFIDGPLTDKLTKLIIAVNKRCPVASGGIMLDPLGGAINKVDRSSTAFIHRNSQYICSITGLYAGDFVPDFVKDWVNESYQALSPFFNGNAYQNYEDIELDESRCYFGEHFERLKIIKSLYDPQNLFSGILSK